MNNWWVFLIGFVTAFSYGDSLEVLDEARIINQRLYLVHIAVSLRRYTLVSPPKLPTKR